MKVGVLQLNPQTLWNRGGGEIHAEKTIEYLKRRGIDSYKFDLSNPTQPDIMHIIGSGNHLVDFAYAAKSKGIKLVITPILFPTKKTLKYKIAIAIGSITKLQNDYGYRKKLLQVCDVIIANTVAEKNYISSAYNIESKNVHVIPTAIDKIADHSDKIFIDTFGVSDYVLMVGRITPLKNQLGILKFLQNYNRKIVIIGEPDYHYPEYVSEVEKIIQLEGNLWLKGLPNGSDLLKSAYTNSRYHILNSDSDVAPLVVLEALGNMSISISRNHESVISLVGDNSYYFSDYNDLKITLDKLDKMSEEERKLKIKKSMEYIAKNHTWAEVAERLEMIYRKII